MARWTIAGLLIGAAFFWPALAEAQKKKNKKAKDQVIEATPAEYALLRAQAGAVGKVGSINDSSKTFMLQIGGAERSDSTGPADPALAAIRSQLKLESVWQQQQRLLAAANPREAVKRLEQLRRAQRQLAHAEVRRQAQVFLKSGKSGGNKGGDGNSKKGPVKQFELEAADKAVVRLGYLPVRYDDKGGIIEYTPRDIEKLRGDKTKPGLAATFADLQAGQVIRVYLARPKTAPPAAKKAAKAKNDEADAESPPRPQVTMILILSEANDPSPPEPKKRKKKN